MRPSLVAVAIEKLYAAEAKKRQREHGGTAPGRKNTGGSPPTSDSDSTKARAKAAEQVGVSPRLATPSKTPLSHSVLTRATRCTRGARMGSWHARYPGGGVRLSTDDRDHTQVQVTISELRRHVHDRITANLCRALAGCDRLTSLAHLSILNNQHLPEGSSVRERNLHTISMLTFGTMRELGKVLTALRGSGIERALVDRDPWFRLDAVRKRWTGERAMRMRDQIAFHLACSTEDAVRGLDALQLRTDHVVLIEYEQTRLSHFRHPIGDEVLLGALELDESDVKAVVDWAAVDAPAMTLDLQAICRDLLRQCGARV